MANPLQDLFQASMASQLDPMNGVYREFSRSMTEEKKQDVIDRRAESIENIERKLKAARKNKSDASVIGAYERLLAQVTGA